MSPLRRPGIKLSRPEHEDVTRLDAGNIEQMTALARLAVERYGIPRDCRLHQFALTENWTFRIETESHAPLVLRLYRPGGRPLIEIRSELAWISAIHAQDESLVPEVISTLDGCQMVEIVRDPPLDWCLCVMFSCAPGHEPAPDELAQWFPSLGAITAQLHRHARSWTPPAWFDRPRWDLATTLGDRPHWGPWHKSVTNPDERAQLQRLADVVTARLQRFGTGPQRFGLVHADLRLANVLANRQGLTVIDFDDCGFSWYLYDLACALTFHEGRADVDELIAAWVEGYRQVELLALEDTEEIPTFLMLRRLLLSAYIGLRPDTDLAKELTQNGFAAETCAIAEGYLRTFG
jgi:Ser/Thr protein kinase RdoA (MazF antagonist)